MFSVGMIGLLFLGCKKLPDGNLSPLVRYEVQSFQILQGRTQVSSALNSEGSNKPLSVKLLKVYNRETNEDVTDVFTMEYPTKIWTAFYDPRVDTTLELINAKRIETMASPISINSTSGQIQANPLTENLPLGKYKFDLEISNAAGSRIYPGIGEFDLVSAPSFAIPLVRSTVAMQVGNEGITRTIPSNNSHMTVTRLNNSEDKIIVRFFDKNGDIFDSRTEIQKRPLAGTNIGFLQTMEDYSIGYTLFSDRTEFIYGTVPFPLISLGNGFNYYYRIPAQFVDFDPSLGLTYNTYSCNVRFSFQAYLTGTYQIDVIVPQVTRVP